MAKKDNEEIPFTAGPGSGASEKLKALQAAMDKIEKNFGKGSITVSYTHLRAHET